MTSTCSWLVGVERADRFVRDALTTNGLHVVVGVNGSGRSAVLDAIAASVEAYTGTIADAPSGSTVLVDDAHLSPEQRLDEIAAAATRSDMTLIVATAPRSFDSRIEKLVSSAGSNRLTLVPLDKAAVSVRAAATARPVSASLAGAIVKSTGGVLAAVDAALGALGGDRSDPAPLRAVAESVAEQHRRMLVEATDDTRALLLAARFGITPDPASAAQIVARASDVESVVDLARSSGMLDTAGTLIPSAEAPLTEAIGEGRCRVLLSTITDVAVRSRLLDATAARALAERSVVHAGLADLLVQQADSAPVDIAGALYDAAVDAGFDSSALAARRSEVAAATGDLDGAGRYADVVLDSAAGCEATHLRTAVRVSASIAAQRGMASRSAQLFSWLGEDRLGPDAVWAALSAAAAGDRSAADRSMAAVSALAPTSSTASGTLLATGVIGSIDSRSPAASGAAANSLMRAIALTGTVSDRACTPDTPAAIAALHAMHCGDLSRVDSIVTRALPEHRPGSEAHTRLSLVGAWASMLRGDTADAGAAIEALRIPASHVRNQLFLQAIRVGLARRSGDAGSLITAWTQAQNVIAEYSTDLFALLPLGELLLAATRLGQVDRVEHLVAQATDLLAALGEPPVWASALHWYQVQAAIVAQTPDALVPHAKALATAAPTHPYSAALAAAGRAWLGVLQGRPDATDVENSARTLTAFGLPWDGARLASEAALTVTDTATATSLLHIARSLRQPSSSQRDTQGSTPQPTGSLSDREAEVAELLVLGVAYREVGSRLYISPKTVEHHVARIRRRLGAESRSELISMLRAMGYGASTSAAVGGVTARGPGAT
ncbi:helix-turn-helix transcriptional regulator [Rhodococcus sp. ARC_M12]|uniref:helix-turn-helix transcriptional regulator n=1 Tax=Rhodococcus sp. ARC_M12 TaxID=2928854 RepID=UPI001FB3F30C|nr:helix-turn-helix transcriptional regulator [Rhodococcus sp. ARC_M12]MCJ0980066.1 helix-turn-helix transcriptional regulator [Rhodococcus sp. ARC_M12]